MNIKKIIQEELNDLSWMDDVSAEPLTVDNLLLISPLNTNAVNWTHREYSEENHIILRITEITENKVNYDVIDSYNTINIGPHGTDLPNAKRLIETGYWRVLDPNTPLTNIKGASDVIDYVIYDGAQINLKESDDLSWMDEIPGDVQVRPNNIIDVANSISPVDVILRKLHDEGYAWIRGTKIVKDNEINDIWTKYDRTMEGTKFIAIGPISRNNGTINGSLNVPHKEIVYTENNFQNHTDYGDLDIYVT